MKTFALILLVLFIVTFVLFVIAFSNKDSKSYDKIGAIAEVLGVFYKCLIKQGSTQKQPLQLTQTYMAITFTPKG